MPNDSNIKITKIEAVNQTQQQHKTEEATTSKRGYKDR